MAGNGGSTTSGNGGSTTAGGGGATSGNGGSTIAGSGGTTSAGTGGSTSAGSGGSTSAGTGGSGTGGTTSAGTGGSTLAGNGGTTSAGTGGASAGSGGTTSAGTGGAAAGAGGGTGGTVGVDKWTCYGDYAYWATGVFYDSPTPQPLIDAFKEMTGVGVYPVTLVLHMQQSALIASLSGTEPGGSSNIFPLGFVPSASPAVASFGQPPGITTNLALDRSYLRFVDKNGPVLIAVDSIVWKATEGVDCNDVLVTFDGIIPKTEYTTVLHLADGDVTIGDLVTDGGGGPPVDGGNVMLPTEVRFIFQGAPTSFDFSTL